MPQSLLTLHRRILHQTGIRHAAFIHQSAFPVVGHCRKILHRQAQCRAADTGSCNNIGKPLQIKEGGRPLPESFSGHIKAVFVPPRKDIPSYLSILSFPCRSFPHNTGRSLFQYSIPGTAFPSAGQTCPSLPKVFRGTGGSRLTPAPSRPSCRRRQCRSSTPPSLLGGRVPPHRTSLRFD